MNISGRMKVKSLKKEFNAEFGLVLRVYDGNKFADDDATIASLRNGGEIKGEFSPQKNMKVGSFEDRMKADFGLKIQIAGSDDSYLCSDDLTLSKSLENDKKRNEKRSKQNNDSEEVNETKIRSTIERTQKKVLEPGPMNGEGKLNTADGDKQNSNNGIPLKEQYLIYFLDQTFDNVHDFISETNNLFKNFSWESEIDCEAISDLYNGLTEITLTNCPRYGGYLYLFTQISEKMGEGEYNTYFNWGIAREFGYHWNDIISNGETVVHLVGKKYEKNNFDIYFSSLFVLTLLRSVDDATAEDIAEFIVANDIHAYGEVFKDVDVSTKEDYIADYVIAILNAAGYDIYDYEGKCTINGIYFNRGFEMGYDYLRLAEDFRDSNV